MIIRAPFNMMLGYGHVAGNISKRLPHSLINPIGNAYLTTDWNSFEDQRLNFYSKIDKERNQPCLTIWHEYDLINHHIGTGRMVAFPFFEVNVLDQIRKFHLNYCDDIIVASEWAKSVLLNNGVKKPVHVIPCGVDHNIFYPNMRENSNTYNFFTIGKIEKRKHTLELPKLFSRAFSEHDDVHFHIICDSPLSVIKQMMPLMEKAVEDSGMSSQITLHKNIPTDMGLANWIRSMDCGVFMTRAEGYGLPILQSLACGKPVITTNYSAHTEFANPDNTYPVDINEFEPATDGVWFKGLGTWASIKKPQEEQCIEYMRRLVSYNIRSIDAGVDKFTWDRCAEKVEAVVNAQY